MEAAMDGWHTLVLKKSASRRSEGHEAEKICRILRCAISRSNGHFCSFVTMLRRESLVTWNSRFLCIFGGISGYAILPEPSVHFWKSRHGDSVVCEYRPMGMLPRSDTRPLRPAHQRRSAIIDVCFPVYGISDENMGTHRISARLSVTIWELPCHSDLPRPKPGAPRAFWSNFDRVHAWEMFP